MPLVLNPRLLSMAATQGAGAAGAQDDVAGAGRGSLQGRAVALAAAAALFCCVVTVVICTAGDGRHHYDQYDPEDWPGHSRLFWNGPVCTFSETLDDMDTPLT